MLEINHWDSFEDARHADVVREAVLDIHEDFEKHGSEKVLGILADTIAESPNGLDYSKIEMDGDSSDSIIVVSNPWVNRLAPHRLLQSLLLRQAAQRAGITDEKGNFLSVITFAAPTSEKSPDLSNGHDAIDELAITQLEALRLMGYKKAVFTGYSQGASVAASMGSHSTAKDLDVKHVAIGDPATVMERSRMQLMKDMAAVKPKQMHEAMDSSILGEYHATFTGELDGAIDYGSMRKTIELLRDTFFEKTNRLHVMRSLGRATLFNHVNFSVSRGASVALAYGSESRITPEKPLLNGLIAANTVDTANTGRVVLRNMVGHNHAWGDVPELVTAHYLENMPQEL